MLEAAPKALATQLGSYSDLDLARQGLTNAIAAYLEGKPADTEARTGH